MNLQEKVQELEKRIKELETRIGDASILLADYDGYYNPLTKTGDARELAGVIDDAYIILQTDHWLEKRYQPIQRKFDPLPEEHHDIDD